ncbi:hypothetical protein Tco_0988220 [Tanacetum coccineum]|uniref:Uncharacterized protein n=1 Tax=Tanacetum coccineum TaxID=301880 RepID=A0ABQ5EQA8_9ASTR
MIEQGIRLRLDDPATAKGRGYAGELTWCIGEGNHQQVRVSYVCKCHSLSQGGECRTRIPVAGGNSLQNVTCFGCGNLGN